MKEWVNDSVEHIKVLRQSPAGTFHPIYFTFAFYLLVLWLIRLAISGLWKLFGKRGE
ncbi:MAG: hypothetical protein L3J42_02190 [Hydrogenimonas sp.]|nr:hypothetical protein [Hydrogenimonas sp.]